MNLTSKLSSTPMSFEIARRSLEAPAYEAEKVLVRTVLLRLSHGFGIRYDHPRVETPREEAIDRTEMS